MTESAFFPSFDRLPDTLPIFPLENAVVMPGSDLPLNIFEPRYLNMVADVLATHHMFGMVQPDPSRYGSPPPVYRTGCAGRITSYRETADGRILLVLTGICRFDITGELPTARGYRLVVPDWSRFDGDRKPGDQDLGEDRQRLLQALRAYLDANGLEVDWEALVKIPGLRLVHTLTTVLPLEPAEKQSIVDAVEPGARTATLVAALATSVEPSPDTRLH